MNRFSKQLLVAAFVGWPAIPMLTDAAHGGGSTPQAPYTTPPTTTTLPVTSDGDCQLVGLDGQLADPTFLDPSGEHVLGITQFIEFNPAGDHTGICSLQIAGEPAMRLYALLDSMLSEGVEVPEPTIGD